MDNYIAASKLLSPLLRKGGPGLKTLAFGGKGPAPSASVYATVVHTLRCVPVLDAVASLAAGGRGGADSGVFSTVRDRALCYVLLYELLLGPHKSIRGGGAVKRAIVQSEKALRDAVLRLAEVGSAAQKRIIASGGADDEEEGTDRTSKEKMSVNDEVNDDDDDDIAGADGAANGVDGGRSRAVPVSSWPVYARVNTLLTSLPLALSSFSACFPSCSLDSVALHPIVPDLLVLSPSLRPLLHGWDFVKEGKVVLQDLSSCLPALALASGYLSSSPRGSSLGRGEEDGGDRAGGLPHFLDACAAPGNKTTHLADLVSRRRRPEGGEGCVQVLALDRDGDRVKILNKRVKLLAPNGEVITSHEDFLKTKPADKRLQRLKGILLDPSCSGSGLISAPDRLAPAARSGDSSGSKESEAASARLKSLASFQLLTLVHALSFPQVDFVSYSTCSVHDCENEEVVAKALEEANGKQAKKDREEEGASWRVVGPRGLERWHRRGNECEGLTPGESAALCRADPWKGDETNGFFVAYFERERCASAARGRGGDVDGRNKGSECNEELGKKGKVEKRGAKEKKAVATSREGEGGGSGGEDELKVPKNGDTTFTLKDGKTTINVYSPGMFASHPKGDSAGGNEGEKRIKARELLGVKVAASNVKTSAMPNKRKGRDEDEDEERGARQQLPERSGGPEISAKKAKKEAETVVKRTSAVVVDPIHEKKRKKKLAFKEKQKMLKLERLAKKGATEGGVKKLSASSKML